MVKNTLSIRKIVKNGYICESFSILVALDMVDVRQGIK